MIAKYRSCCVGAGSLFCGTDRECQSKFDAHFTARHPSKQPMSPCRSRGVGFFDFAHGQQGAAPNIIELHPVLDIAFISPMAAPIFRFPWPRPRYADSRWFIVPTISTATTGVRPVLRADDLNTPSGVSSQIHANWAREGDSLSDANQAAATGSFPLRSPDCRRKSHSQTVQLNVTPFSTVLPQQ